MARRRRKRKKKDAGSRKDLWVLLGSIAGGLLLGALLMLFLIGLDLHKPLGRWLGGLGLPNMGYYLEFSWTNLPECVIALVAGLLLVRYIPRRSAVLAAVFAACIAFGGQLSLMLFAPEETYSVWTFKFVLFIWICELPTVLSGILGEWIGCIIQSKRLGEAAPVEEPSGT